VTASAGDSSPGHEDDHHTRRRHQRRPRPDRARPRPPTPAHADNDNNDNNFGSGINAANNWNLSAADVCAQELAIVPALAPWTGDAVTNTYSNGNVTDHTLGRPTHNPTPRTGKPADPRRTGQARHAIAYRA